MIVCCKHESAFRKQLALLAFPKGKRNPSTSTFKARQVKSFSLLVVLLGLCVGPFAG